MQKDADCLPEIGFIRPVVREFDSQSVRQFGSQCHA
jgi:hypothetical protein